MKKLIPLFILMFLGGNMFCQETVATLESGEVILNVKKTADEDTYSITFTAYDREFNTASPDNPVTIKIYSRDNYYKYTDFEKTNGQMKMRAMVTYRTGACFEVNDVYIPDNDGGFEMRRNIKVLDAGTIPEHNSFASSFNIKLKDQSELLENDYFIPSVWYRGNFTEDGNLPSGLPMATDKDFFYREDRTPLPVLMMRERSSGLTLTLVLKNSECNTIVNDINDKYGITPSAAYQFGGVGVYQNQTTGKLSTTAYVTFPGSDTRAGGLGDRFHPINAGFDKHSYNVYIKINKSNNYPDALKYAWEKAFNFYNPEIRYVDLTSAHKGLIETLDHYYLEPGVNGVGAPGFPWGINLHTFGSNISTYEMGFVGSQPAAGYALFRAGVEQNNNDYIRKGGSVIDVWSNSKAISPLGLPRANINSWTGEFHDNYTNMRQASSGMAAILNAWCFAKKNGIDRPQWLNACKKYGDFLVSHQNDDGSYNFSYHPNRIEGGKHPEGSVKNKFLTVCVLRYLVELYIATGDEQYKTTALKAAEFCYNNNHRKYLYVAGVTDNPQTIDSESGQQAINGFLAIYDLTKETKWLDAAEQAATYTETWSFMHEVPVEIDQTGETDFPKHRSIVGQHLIAIGHSGSDLGFAWSSFVFYRLYLITGKEHYLKIARIAAHNVKQSMNLNRELYPGQPEGLQLEVFQVGIPRRKNAVMEALTWNYAAHLDPMVRFKDAFDTYDLEEAEALSKEQREELNWRYSFYQSSDYGQYIEIPPFVGMEEGETENVSVWTANKQLYINIGQKQDKAVCFRLQDLSGRTLYNGIIPLGESIYYQQVEIKSGIYILTLNFNKNTYTQKIYFN